MHIEFEADLCPDTRAPRMRFNFSNGWSASVVLRQTLGGLGSCDFNMASLAACPTGKWGEGLTDLGETEASAGEVAAFLWEVRGREDVNA